MDKQRKISWSWYSRFVGIVMLLTMIGCSSVEDPSDAERASITFILSSDSPGKHYFGLATEHFSMHPRARTSEVTAECRSIACVIDYLNHRSDGKKWGVVNLVAHGNSKTGLNLYLSDGGHKATPKRMVQEAAIGTLPLLNGSTVDSATRINIYACGIGTNPLIAMSMKRILRSDGSSDADIDCASEYIVFRTDANGVVQKLEAEYWPYYYKRGYRPSISKIESDMQKQYPKDKDLWLEMLDSPTDDGWTMDYHIPVSYTRIYKEKNKRPRVDTYDLKMEWVREQGAIVDKLEELDMEYEDFHWHVDRRIIRDIDGAAQYAVKAVGMATAMCFLKPKAEVHYSTVAPRQHQRLQ